MVRGIIYSALCLSLIFISGCGGGDSGDGAIYSPPLKVILFINGELGDKSFFDSAQRGLDKAVEVLGIKAKTIEAGWDSDLWLDAFMDAVENEDYDVFIVGTYSMVSFLSDIAGRYPDKKFILFDATVDYAFCDCGNVYSIKFKQNEGAYLAGVYAAAMTTQDISGMNSQAVIGAVGGMEQTVIDDFIIGFAQGARDVNPDIRVIHQFAYSWIDADKARDIATYEYANESADIVFQIAGAAGEGVFQAAEENGRFAIGVDSDQAEMYEESNPRYSKRILTSMLKNVDNAIYRAIDYHIKGVLTYGRDEALGLAEGGVDLAANDYYEAATPDSVKVLVQAAKQDILDGKIQVKTAFEPFISYDDFGSEQLSYGSLEGI